MSFLGVALQSVKLLSDEKSVVSLISMFTSKANMLVETQRYFVLIEAFRSSNAIIQGRFKYSLLQKFSIEDFHKRHRMIWVMQVKTSSTTYILNS